MPYDEDRAITNLNLPGPDTDPRGGEVVLWGSCPRCGERAPIRHRTDGEGHTEEYVECESVSCRRADSAFRPRPGWKLLWCEGCGRPFSRPIARGRYPTACPGCR